MGKYGGLGGERVRAFHTPGLDTLHITFAVKSLSVFVGFRRLLNPLSTSRHLQPMTTDPYSIVSHLWSLSFGWFQTPTDYHRGASLSTSLHLQPMTTNPYSIVSHLWSLNFDRLQTPTYYHRWASLSTSRHLQPMTTNPFSIISHLWSLSFGRFQTPT